MVEVIRIRLRSLNATIRSSLYKILKIQHGQISSRKSILLTRFKGSDFADLEMAHVREGPWTGQ